MAVNGFFPMLKWVLSRLLTVRRTACREARLVRVPNIESIRAEQKRFLKEFDRQVAEIE